MRSGLLSAGSSSPVGFGVGVGYASARWFRVNLAMASLAKSLAWPFGPWLVPSPLATVGYLCVSSSALRPLAALRCGARLVRPLLALESQPAWSPLQTVRQWPCLQTLRAHPHGRPASQADVCGAPFFPLALRTGWECCAMPCPRKVGTAPIPLGPNLTLLRSSVTRT